MYATHLASVNQDSGTSSPDQVSVRPLQLHRTRIPTKNPHDSVCDFTDIFKTRQGRALTGEVFLPKVLVEWYPQSHLFFLFLLSSYSAEMIA